MKRAAITLLSALFFAAPANLAFSEGEPAPATTQAGSITPGAALAAPAQTITYELRDLKPSGITQFSPSSDIVRHLLEFRNEQGSHHIIYEELASAPPLRTVASLRELASSFGSSCSIDVECTSKAFCTGDCRNMYYETANAAGDTYAPDRNKCRVQYFSCEKAAAFLRLLEPSRHVECF